MATATLDDHIQGLKSPMLVAVTELKLRHISESPPLVSRDSSAVPSDDEEGKDTAGLERGDQGDCNLISALGPNNLLAATNALKFRLPTERTAGIASMSIDQPSTSASDEDHAVQQRPRLKEDRDRDGDFLARIFPTRKESLDGPEGSLVQNSRRLSLHDRGPPSPSAEKKVQYDTRPPPLQRTSLPLPHDSEEDSLAKSPLLSQFTIDGRHADPDNVLAALHTTSPARPSVGSAEVRQTLPSLTTALGDASSPFPVSSPHLSRSASSFGPPLSSISSAMSPPSMSSNPHLWKSSRERTNSTSTPSDQTASTPHSAWAALSPSNSLPTPLSTTSSNGPPHLIPSSFPTSACSNGILLSPTHPQGVDHSANSSISSAAAAAAAINGIFRCTVPGCTAAPFQTQYLLNSHANVHSDTRPHFCPVANCPRGPGGQGFKRKNEMIRHGLVHTSPGYTCPFCPDQQHRYPRPDNLQRHVRVHHMEKDRDDPQLREVLAQRPEGGSRGRRRRLGS